MNPQHENFPERVKRILKQLRISHEELADHTPCVSFNASRGGNAKTALSDVNRCQFDSFIREHAGQDVEIY